LYESTPGATVRGIADDLGIERGTLRGWLETLGTGKKTAADGTLTRSTLKSVTPETVPKKTKPEPSAEELAAKELAAKELVRVAREQGLSLTGPDGLLKQFTESVLETAFNEKMTEHLGHEEHRAPSTSTRPRSVRALRPSAMSPQMKLCHVFQPLC
jgi:transposase-like protein